MSQNMEIGNSVQPLRNVAALSKLIKGLENRQHGLDGMGVFYGPPGYGKTHAAVFAASALDAIHISVQELWTRKTLLKQVLRELGVAPVSSQAEMLMQANEALAMANRPLIIDEADYAVQRGLIPLTRDFHDGSGVPTILIGMEELPQKLRKFEMVHSRVLIWTPAQPADLKDVRLLANYYGQGITFDDPLLQHIIARNTGNVRYAARDIAHVKSHCQLQGVTSMTLADWGKTPWPQDEAPVPRRGLK